ncbi:MAG: MarR family winged helix-turn-helix transcriptional regulator [Xanthobacteraceae bacterium]|nr:MarR family winged helix-turn-helix transcriptional regulator [Xanthobacteraceae bacterium]
MAANTKRNPGRGRTPERPAARAADISLGAKLMTLSNLMRRIMAMRFQRLFQLSLVEGWIVSHIGAGGPMSLDELAYRCGLNKSQMSRGVTTMVKRALVDRRRNPDNPNGVILTLTPNGRKVYREIRGLWPRYNRLLMAGLNEREVAAFATHVAALIENSRGNLMRERRLGAADESG